MKEWTKKGKEERKKVQKKARKEERKKVQKKARKEERIKLKTESPHPWLLHFPASLWPAPDDEICQKKEMRYRYLSVFVFINLKLVFIHKKVVSRLKVILDLFFAKTYYIKLYLEPVVST